MLLTALLVIGQAAEIKIDHGLALPPVSRYGRDPAPIDPVALQFSLGKWQPPKAADEVVGAEGRKGRWAELKAGQDGAFTGPAMNGGYLYAPIDMPKGKVMILEASGHGMVYVNGEPRAGDTYSYGFVKLPVKLKQGRNDFVFNVPRGRMTARLVEPKEDFFLNPGDMTLPDIVGMKSPGQGAIVVVNATDQPLSDVTMVATFRGIKPIRTPVRGSVPALSCRKVGFDIPEPGLIDGSSCKLSLRLERAGKQSEEIEVDIRVRSAKQTRKVTFTSAIDGSVQYYAVVPSSGPSRATVLSLHGASVEAIGQADAYSPKDWCTIVCPTNRRPYGFDWEDWGRLDAVEVLYKFPQPYFLTGHSMGGHGTWSLAVHDYPYFAAIGPSAGWISFWTYAGGRRYDKPDDIEKILARAASDYDTKELAKNLADKPVYILHGEKDDNVPVAEARTMRDLLVGLGADVTYFEQPGAGHWWDVSPDPGADCVDWKPMFDMFKGVADRWDQMMATAGAGRETVELTTFKPWSKKWLSVFQERPMEKSTVSITLDPKAATLKGTTENASAIVCTFAHLKDRLERVRVTLDGQDLGELSTVVPASTLVGERLLVALKKVKGRWEATKPETLPTRFGDLGFKSAFWNHMLFVYGTKGNAEENAWALAKSRFDAETFWYRGNGSIDVIPDYDYDLAKYPGRSAILYGHSQSNSAWPKLLKNSPLQVRRGWLRIGPKVIRGEDKACLFLYPVASDVAGQMVGVVCGTGPVGMRLTDRLPYFVSGVAYPDWTVISPEMYKTGSKGIIGAGFFGNDWKYSAANSAWRE